MDHQIVAGAVMGAIEQVRVAEIESAMKLALGIELVLSDGVETFGRLRVPSSSFGPSWPDHAQIG